MECMQCLNEDLRYSSYRGQLHTEKSREKRLKNAKKLMNDLVHLGQEEFLLEPEIKRGWPAALRMFRACYRPYFPRR